MVRSREDLNLRIVTGACTSKHGVCHFPPSANFKLFKSEQLPQANGLRIDGMVTLVGCVAV